MDAIIEVFNADEKQRQVRAAELQILYKPDFEYKEELIEYKAQLIQELLKSEIEYQAKHDPEFNPELFEAELHLLSETELLVKKHPCCPSHCCIYHGCKYGDDDCPVKSGQIRQEYICERCGEVGIKNVEQAIARHQGAASRKFLRELSRRAALYNDPFVDKFVAALYTEARVDPATVNKENSNGSGIR